MNTHHIDYLNIGLMLLSVALALTIPFELFLFAYVVVSPLHYLTEISWLKHKNFFTKGKKDYFLLTSLCAITTIAVVMVYLLEFQVNFVNKMGVIPTPELISLTKLISISLVFIAFLTALVFLLFKNFWSRFLIIGLGIVAAYMLQNVYAYRVLFGVFMTTLIHGSIFTGLFMLYGALKSKSKPGYVAFAIFILCNFLFFLVYLDPVAYPISDTVKNYIFQGDFHKVNYHFYQWFFPNSGNELILDSLEGLQIQSFIAFTFTYHYLNWFSKTEIIRWHKVPRPWIIASIVIWIFSVGLNLYDLKIGLLFLFFLATLHVFLEFPLNHLSIIEIGKAIGQRFKAISLSK